MERRRNLPRSASPRGRGTWTRKSGGWPRRRLKGQRRCSSRPTRSSSSCEDLSCYYGSFRAVREISLQVPKNRITALIGPSGCGKSTLLRSFNRMNDLVDSAHIEGPDPATTASTSTPTASTRSRCGAGSAWSSRSRTRSRRVDLRQRRASARASRATAGSMDELVERSLRRAALWDEVKDKLASPGTALSGGQQQRLCIARAIAVEPDVILMDEPCSALDPIATLQIEELMRELKENYTIVIVTHNMQQAARASDDTAFLTMGDDRAGYLVEMAPTQQLFTSPREPADRGLHHRPVRLGGDAWSGRSTPMRSPPWAIRRSTRRRSRRSVPVPPRAFDRGSSTRSRTTCCASGRASSRRSSERAAPSCERDVGAGRQGPLGGRRGQRAAAPDQQRDRGRHRDPGPVARDIRELLALYHAAAELERMGDYAVNIAKLAQQLASEPEIPILRQIPRMEQLCREQLRAAMRALVDISETEARAVCARRRRDRPPLHSVYEDVVQLMSVSPGACSPGDSHALRRPSSRAARRPGDEHRRGRRLPGDRPDRGPQPIGDGPMRRRLLLVEDDPTLRQALTFNLAGRGTRLRPARATVRRLWRRPANERLDLDPARRHAARR